ncbi:MAG: DUF480 domain-containing protein, partial [Acidobacteriota bacterium]
MPLPVAHSLIGASLVTLAMRRLDWRLDWGPILTGAILGALPDLDLILSWGLGLGLHYHGSYTHSALFALSAGAAAALLRGEEHPRAVSGYVGAVLSHGLLDALTNACNQKNHRDPVVSYDESVVQRALDTLREKSLVYTFHGSESRSVKYG